MQLIHRHALGPERNREWYPNIETSIGNVEETDLDSLIRHEDRANRLRRYRSL